MQKPSPSVAHMVTQPPPSKVEAAEALLDSDLSEQIQLAKSVRDAAPFILWEYVRAQKAPKKKKEVKANG